MEYHRATDEFPSTHTKDIVTEIASPLRLGLLSHLMLTRLSSHAVYLSPNSSILFVQFNSACFEGNSSIV